MRARKVISIPAEYNYIGVFLTFDCRLMCSYCINIAQRRRPCYPREMSKQEWVRGLNRIQARDDLPLTLQGGEPTYDLSKFIYIVMRVNKPMDLLTNGIFDLTTFMRHIPPDKFKRNAPYASIRVSFHPDRMSLGSTVKRTQTMLKNGYQVGVWMVKHPKYPQAYLNEVYKEFTDAGIDFRWKEFLGKWRGKLYGTYLYENAIGQHGHMFVDCRTTELLIGPNGNIYKCHADLYRRRLPVEHILSRTYIPTYEYRVCHNYGNCNPCDVKLKTNRFQEFGHCTVTVNKRPTVRGEAAQRRLDSVGCVSRLHTPLES